MRRVHEGHEDTEAGHADRGGGREPLVDCVLVDLICVCDCDVGSRVVVVRSAVKKAHLDVLPFVKL